MAGAMNTWLAGKDNEKPGIVGLGEGDGTLSDELDCRVNAQASDVTTLRESTHAQDLLPCDAVYSAGTGRIVHTVLF